MADPNTGFLSSKPRGPEASVTYSQCAAFGRRGVHVGASCGQTSCGEAGCCGSSSAGGGHF